MPSQSVLTVGAVGAGHSQIEGRRMGRCVAERGLPLRLQHERQAVDHHVQKTADHQAQQSRQGECHHAVVHVKKLAPN